MSSDQKAGAAPPSPEAPERIARAVIAAIRACVPLSAAGQRIALHEPCFAGREWDYVKECIDTGWVSSAGRFVERFETMLAERVGAAAAVATVNGTTALHAALLLSGVEPGDEVIVPTLTFVATANAVSHCGAVPHFVDSAADTLGMNPARLERHLATAAERRGGHLVNRRTGRVIRAMVPVHIFGHPADLDPLVALARDLKIALVEDAAEALGSQYKGRPIGCGDWLSVFSFNGNKTITTGGGGAIASNNLALATAAKHLTSTARLANGWNFDHDRVGYNYRMPNLNAALGCAQLEQLDGFIARKRALAARYATAFAQVDQIRFFAEPAHGRSNYWLNAILLDRGVSDAREAVLAATNAAGLETRPAWTLMHQLPMYRDCPHDDLCVAQDIAACLINVPSGPAL
ncbi:MAG: LegC family aminotransferase [Xanthobacteraceae bacterium]